MAERECGGCTACCKTHMVLAINKPPMTWCEQCAVGRGCKTYNQRPRDCSVFKCLWLLGRLPEHERPDKTRIVIDLIPSPLLGHDTIGIYEVSWGALNTEPARREKNRALESNCVVTEMMSSGKLRMTFPQGYRLSKEKGETLVRELVEISLYRPR